MKNKERELPVIQSGSMADIAFLLLIFFLVTTTIVNDKGLFLVLPPADDNQPIVNIPERNIFTVVINSQGKLLVENQEFDGTMEDLTSEIKEFVTNYGVNKKSSDSPSKAVVSYLAYRGVTHGQYIEVLDAIKYAYHQIYAERAGVTVEEWRKISDSHSDPKAKSIYKKGRGENENGFVEIPVNISIATL